MRCTDPADLIFETRGRGLLGITGAVAEVVGQAGVECGLAQLFVHHTSCSLIVGENADPAVGRDTLAFFERLVPDGDPLFEHRDEGPDDMPAHLRSMLTATSLAIPVRAGRLDLGTWQGLFLFEHRTAPHRRRVSVVLIGSTHPQDR